MKRSVCLISLAILAGSPGLVSQSTSTPLDTPAFSYQAGEHYPSNAFVRAVRVMEPDTITPFSRVAFGGGISPMGFNLQAAMNVNRYANIRSVGNLFSYSLSNVDSNGMNLNGNLNFASLGTSLDIYPFPDHEFRLSPGVLLVNQNELSANMFVAGGSSFELNGVKYLASNIDPITGKGHVGFNTRNPAFTMTAGWGNMLSRHGKRVSFPVEVGAAFVGAPSVTLALTGGQACDQYGMNCVNVATDPTVQANLQAQAHKYTNSLSPFRYYPIVSVGVSYNFNLRPQNAVR